MIFSTFYQFYLICSPLVLLSLTLTSVCWIHNTAVGQYHKLSKDKLLPCCLLFSFDYFDTVIKIYQLPVIVSFVAPVSYFLWALQMQIPLFGGILSMEKAAARISWLLGRSGKHLFLTDARDGKPPLLLQMADDCEDLKFM